MGSDPNIEKMKDDLKAEEYHKQLHLWLQEMKFYFEIQLTFIHDVLKSHIATVLRMILIKLSE
ncbi:UNVERIFIED_CONTAM: hypothetical protein NCL1_25354 [Trichonephila clavipes]